MSRKHVHILGASGSGTTTIAEHVCQRLGYVHFDSDNYFWLPTHDPFTVERPRDECIRLMEHDLVKNGQWVLSGSLTGWGDPLTSLFDLVVFVYIPQTTRMDRLQKREYKRYGDAMLPGGSQYDKCSAFLTWAAAYDASTRNGRSLKKHEAWLATLQCPVLRVHNDDLRQSVEAVLAAIRQ